MQYNGCSYLFAKSWMRERKSNRFGHVWVLKQNFINLPRDYLLPTPIYQFFRSTDDVKITFSVQIAKVTSSKPIVFCIPAFAANGSS